MAKYTDEQLQKMAEETLCLYNLSDPRADHMINILAQVTMRPVAHIVFELNKLANQV